MVISLPISKTKSVAAAGVGVLVLVGEAVCVGIMNCWVDIGELVAGKSATVGLTAVTDGVIVTAALGAIPADWGVVIPPSPARLQPTTNSKKMKSKSIKCVLETIPINPLRGGKGVNPNNDQSIVPAV